MSNVLFHVPMVWVTVLNEVSELELTGETLRANALLAKMREKYVLDVPGRFLTAHGMPYRFTPPLEICRGLGLSPRSLGESEIQKFAEVGWPMPHEGDGFNLALVHVPRYELSLGGMDILLREFAAEHACLREGLLFLERDASEFDHYSVHFFGSRRPDGIGAHANVPVISMDAGIRLLSQRRIDTGDPLFAEVYAIVRRSLPIG